MKEMSAIRRQPSANSAVMTASEYLKVQTDLLISADLLRRSRLEEFVEATRAVEVHGGLRDRDGLDVQTTPERMRRLAEGAMDMLKRGAA